MKQSKPINQGGGPLRPKRPPPRNPLEIPDIEPHERDSAAFWFRRVATTAVIGNGVGVAALASFLGETSDLRLGAQVAYTSVALYLTGALLGFCSFIGSLFWAAFRMDAYAEHYVRLREQFGKEKSPEFSRSETAFSAFAVVLSLTQIGVLVGAGVCFYFASRSAVVALGILACEPNASADICTRKPSFLFPAWEAPDTTGEARRSAPSSTLPVSIRTPKSPEPSVAGKPAFLPEWIVVAPAAIDPELRISSNLVVRLSRHDIESPYHCWMQISDYSEENTSPLLRSRKLNRFIEHTSIQRPSSDITPLWIDIFAHRGEGMELRAASLRIDVTSPEHPRLPSNDIPEITLRGIPGPDYSGGLLVYSVSKDPSTACLSLARELGFRISR